MNAPGGYALVDRAGSKLADQAHAADLLGGIVNDLRPFDYQPPDPVGYQALMDATLGVFEREARAFDVQTK